MKKPHLTHIQSYQSLSVISGQNGASDVISGLSGTKSTNKLSQLAMTLGNKPLNRNSRRASMSELGYGKIESYNKLDKLGEVKNFCFFEFLPIF